VKTDIAPVIARPARKIAEIEFSVVNGSTVVTRWRASNPFKLLVPHQRDRSAWVIGSNFGGGMLAGDEVDLTIASRAGSRGIFGTQASTKIYRSPAGATARQTLTAELEADSLLAVLPDPVACFADARYEQRQRFNLSVSASLVALDWFTSGRIARGERWAMERYRSLNEIVVDGRRIAHDAVQLDRADGPIDTPFRTGRFNCLATAFIIGPMFTAIASDLLTAVHARPMARQSDLLVSASPLPGGAILRVAGVSIELVKSQLCERLAFLNEPLGIDPWSRKW